MANLYLSGKEKVFATPSNSPYLNSQHYPRYRRTDQSEIKVFIAIESLARKLSWKSIGLVLSKTSYGTARANAADLVFKKSKILCIAFQSKVSNYGLVELLKSSKHVDVILLWLKVVEGFKFLKLAQKEKLFNKTWIASPALSSIRRSTFVRFNRFLVQGMILLPNFEKGKTDDLKFYGGFTNYFSNIASPNFRLKPWLHRVNVSQAISEISTETYSMVENIYLSLVSLNHYINKSLIMFPSSNISQFSNAMDLFSTETFDYFVGFDSIHVYVINIDLIRNKKILKLKKFATVYTVSDTAKVMLSSLKKISWAGYVIEFPSQIVLECVGLVFIKF